MKIIRGRGEEIRGGERRGRRDDGSMLYACTNTPKGNTAIYVNNNFEKEKEKTNDSHILSS